MFQVFKWVWRGLLVTVLMLSLAINIASFTGSALWKTASLAWEGATGTRSFVTTQAEKVKASKSQSRLAKKKLDNEILSNKRLTTKLVDTQSDLVSERKISKRFSSELSSAQAKALSNQRTIEKLKKEIAAPSKRLVYFKGRKVPLRNAVRETADRVSRRATKTASREIASMPGESIPFWGTAVIVGVTALELYDLCETLKDMNALKRAFNPEHKPDPQVSHVCSMRVPTKEQLWETTKSAPGAAWAAAKGLTPSLVEIKEWEMPDIDAKDMWSSTKDGTASVAGWVKEQTITTSAKTAEKVREFSGDALDATSFGIESLTSKAKSFFSYDEE